MKFSTGFILTTFFSCASAYAIPPQAESRVASTLGMIGISQYETARLNLVNIDDPNIISIIPNLCQAQLRFMDETGKVLAKSDIVLINGQAGHLDFTQGKISESNRRKQIRAEIATLEAPVVASAANCVATIEIFNSRTGRTSALYPVAPRLDLGGPVIDPPLVPQTKK